MVRFDRTVLLSGQGTRRFSSSVLPQPTLGLAHVQLPSLNRGASMNQPLRTQELDKLKVSGRLREPKRILCKLRETKRIDEEALPKLLP